MTPVHMTMLGMAGLMVVFVLIEGLALYEAVRDHNRWEVLLFSLTLAASGWVGVLAVYTYLAPGGVPVWVQAGMLITTLVFMTLMYTLYTRDQMRRYRRKL